MAETPKKPRMIAKAEAAPPPGAMMVITIRGTREWRMWLDRVAKHCRTDSSKLIDVAVANYAKSQGFAEPPPER